MKRGEEELPSPSVFVTALDIQKMIQLRLILLMYFGIWGKVFSWKGLKHQAMEVCGRKYSVEPSNEENSIILERREHPVSDSPQWRGNRIRLEMRHGRALWKTGYGRIPHGRENFSGIYGWHGRYPENSGKKVKRHSCMPKIYYSHKYIDYLYQQRISIRLASRINSWNFFDPRSLSHGRLQAAAYIRQLTDAIRIYAWNPAEYDDEYYRGLNLLPFSPERGFVSLTVIRQVIGF